MSYLHFQHSLERARPDLDVLSELSRLLYCALSVCYVKVIWGSIVYFGIDQTFSLGKELQIKILQNQQAGIVFASSGACSLMHERHVRLV